MLKISKKMKCIVAFFLLSGSALGKGSDREVEIYKQVLANIRNPEMISRVERYLSSSDKEAKSISGAITHLETLRDFFISKNYEQAKMVNSILMILSPDSNDENLIGEVKSQITNFSDHIQSNPRMADKVKQFALLELSKATENLKTNQVELDPIELLAEVNRSIKEGEINPSKIETSFTPVVSKDDSVRNYFVWGISLLVMYFVFRFHFTFKLLKVTKRHDESIKDLTGNDKNWFLKTKSVSLAKIDQQGKVVSCNDVFKNEFQRQIEMIGSWDEFFMNSFYKDEALRGVRRLFKYNRDLKNDYFVHSRMNSKSGIRFVEIFKMDTRELALLGNKRKLY